MHFSTTCIDDFFKYPNSIRNYANSLKYKPDPDGRWPGVRTEALHLLEDGPLCFEICDKYLANFYTIESLMAGEVNCSYDAFFQKVSNKWGGGWIHNDSRSVHTTIIYLTPNISDDSGTSIFIPKPDATAATVAGTNAASAVPSREVFMPVSKTEGFLKKEQFYKSQINLEEAETYRLKNNSPFKEVIRFANIYNRCIGFDGSHWHSSGKFDNVDKEEERLTLIIFWRTIIGPQTGLQRTKMSPI